MKVIGRNSLNATQVYSRAMTQAQARPGVYWIAWNKGELISKAEVFKDLSERTRQDDEELRQAIEILMQKRGYFAGGMFCRLFKTGPLVAFDQI